MEFEFDKEIDSLLRQTAKGENLQQNPSTAHIDADEISMFAENALPEKAKPRITKHLADCGRCRTILSNIIVLNAEDKSAAIIPVQESKAENVVASTEMTWYQKLFSTRNLAYGMGALALIFAVGIGFFVVQNFMSSENASELAQANTNSSVAENMTADDLNASADQEIGNSNLSSPEADLKESDENANSTSNTTISREKPSETSDEGFGERNEPLAKSERKGENESFGKNKSNPAGRRENLKGDSPSDKIATSATEADSSIASSDDRDDLKDEESRRDRSQNDGVAENKPQAEASAPPPPVTARRGVVKPKKKSTKERKVMGDEKSIASGSVTKRQIGNKTFNRKNRVWYDSAYKGQQTTNVRRDTTQYRNLDSDLRNITDKLDGTVVVVWKSKAYRVD